MIQLLTSSNHQYMAIMECHIRKEGLWDRTTVFRATKRTINHSENNRNLLLFRRNHSNSTSRTNLHNKRQRQHMGCISKCRINNTILLPHQGHHHISKVAMKPVQRPVSQHNLRQAV